MADLKSSKLLSGAPVNFKFRRSTKARRPGSVAAIELDERWVRLAQAEPRGNGTAVNRVLVLPLPLRSDADRKDPAVLGGALSAALESAQMKASQVVMGVPRHSVVLRTISLPAIENERELASMVHMQIGRDLPFRAEEAIIDFKVRPQAKTADKPPPDTDPKDGAKSQKREVLVAVVRKETVEFYLKVAAAARLKLVALGWLSEANARAVGACEPAHGEAGLALITLRPDEVGIDVVVGESLVFSRGATIQPGDTPPERVSKGPVPDPASFVEAVTIEVVRSVHSYGGMEGALPVERLAIVGATGQEQAVLAALQTRLSIPCRLLDPATNLQIPQPEGAHAADALGVIGLGLGVNDPGGLPFDFLSAKKPAVQRNTKRIRILAAAAALAAVFICLLAFRSHLMKERTKVQQALQTELTKAEKFVPTYRKMQLQSTTLQNWAKESRNWLEQLAYLSSVLPSSEDVYLTSFTVSGQGIIHMAVQARSGEILASMDKQLRAAGYEVKPIAITPASDKHGYNFRSSVELVAPAKLKIDLGKAQAPSRPADDGSLEGKSRPGRKGGGS